MIKFEWDKHKATPNEKKHGVSFSEAITVFVDPLELTIEDPGHSSGEYRFLSIGRSGAGNIRKIMKKISKENEMQSEYDFSSGVRGKHSRAYQEGSNVVFLEPDIAQVFKDSDSVNHALRMLMELARSELQ